MPLHAVVLFRILIGMIVGEKFDQQLLLHSNHLIARFVKRFPDRSLFAFIYICDEKKKSDDERCFTYYLKHIILEL